MCQGRSKKKGEGRIRGGKGWAKGVEEKMHHCVCRVYEAVINTLCIEHAMNYHSGLFHPFHLCRQHQLDLRIYVHI